MDYKVSPSEDFIDPEETLPDSLSSHSKIEYPISGAIFSLVFFLISGIFIFYLFYAVNLQRTSGKELKEASLQNISLSYYVPPPRGIIYDRRGVELAYNIPDFELLIVSKNLPSNEEKFKELKEQLSIITGKSIEETERILELRRSRSLFTFEENIGREKAIRLSQLNLPGIYVVPVSKREYKDGSYFSHIVGYIGKVAPTDLNVDGYYKVRDRIGKLGLEFRYETNLRGIHGIKNFSDISDELDIQKEKPGNNLVLNIDFEIQKNLHSALSEVLRSAGLSRGAAIIQNPHSGSILALTSFPSYDNNVFQKELSEGYYRYLFNNNDKPLFNRAISGLYSPASTIKPILAIAGLNEGTIRPNTTITDKVGYITVQSIFDPSVIYTYRDWKIQGTVDLRGAIANSSNIYFYSVGGGHGAIDGLGIGKISQYLKKFLADNMLGIDLPGERAGFVPTEEWKIKTRGEPWYRGDTFNVSIGQGDLSVSLLWINSYTSAIANGGTFYRPAIVNRIVDGDKKPVLINEKEEIGKLSIDEKIIREVKEGMREAVVSGTARILSDLPVPVAAKTGTSLASVGRRMNSMVTVLAPHQDSEIVLSVIIEDIKPDQQGLALRVAKSFLEWYFSPNAIHSP